MRNEPFGGLRGSARDVLAANSPKRRVRRGLGLTLPAGWGMLLHPARTARQRLRRATTVSLWGLLAPRQK